MRLNYDIIIRNKMPKMSSKNENQKEIKESAKTAASVTPKVNEATARAKIEGRKAVKVAEVKGELKGLRSSISVNENEVLYKFSAQEKSKIEKALRLNFANLSDKQIKAKIANLSIDKLEKAEDLEKGTGARIFAMLIEGKIEKPLELGYKFKKGNKFRINFHGNEEAEDNYGMRTFFKHQPEVRQVKLSQKNQRGKGREGIATRRTLDGNFYFDDGSYAPIFSNTEIEVIKVWTPQELTDYKNTSTSYKIGKNTRVINKQDKTFYRQNYSFTAPKPSNLKRAEDYWKLIDATVNKPKRLNAIPIVDRKEFVPQSQIEKTFYKKWDEIMAINDPQKLIEMKDEIVMRANDPLIIVPEESRGTRLRSGAALRWALFKRHAQLKGYKAYVGSGYRNAKHQEKIWYRNLARRMRENPHLSRAQVESLNSRYVARPGRSHHNTGGAIDLSIFKNGKKIEGQKFRQSRASYNYALKTGDLSRLRGESRKAIEVRQFLDKELLASHFLSRNYYAETWHWSVDYRKNSGRYIYSNV